uniref:Large ribosomal subunit protein uL3c n=1 Tax=Corynoplastis japonica TaxID=700918 RepID=A0A1X9PVZ8_9RHOD|nr:50S ribosomal protein L3 [Corynoplastis japonica]
MSINMLGTKVGMTQIFNTDGLAIPVTIIKVNPSTVVQIKTLETDGYNAVQLGYHQISEKSVNKPMLGHFKKFGVSPLKYLKEFRIDSSDNFSVGQQITTEMLQVGQLVNVSGTSIGRGFAGLQKRHNFSRGPMTHGSKNHRAPGSIGAGTSPGRVFPGKKMAGRLGGKQVTVQKLPIINIHNEQNLLIIKGSIPGKSGNLISIKVY